ncbi:hypothetical protein MRX96_019144 [Rhipicephalus microplus]
MGDDFVGKIQQSSLVALTEDNERRPVAFATSSAQGNTTAAKAVMVVTKILSYSDPSRAGPPMCRPEPQSHQLRSRLSQSTNAFMLFALEKRPWVATEHLNCNGRRLSSSVEKLYCFLKTVG